MFSQHYDYAVQLNRYCLSIIGVSSDSKDSSFLQEFNKLLIGFTYISILFNLVPCALYTFREETDYSKRINWFGPMSFCVMGFLKYTSLLNSQNSIKHCHKHIENDWKAFENIPNHFTVMMKNAKVGRFLALGCAMFMYGGIALYTYLPILTVQLNSRHIGNKTLPRPFTYAVYSKWINIQRSPTYEIIYSLQTISMLVNSTITVAVCSIAAVFIMHTCGQLEIIIMYLHDLIDTTDVNNRSLQKGMRVIVKHHLRALSFASQIEKILRWICLVEFFGCCANMCLLGYYLITTWGAVERIVSITYVVLFTSFVFNIFIFCYMSEILTEQCRRVGEAAYDVDWYRISGNKSLDLILIILISSFPIKITAGKIIELSYISFSGALKSSAVYLNFLRKVTN